jgi:DNA-binding NtrC family response regulator
MSDDARTTQHLAMTAPLRGLVVRVVEGPDRGREARGEVLTLGSAEGNDVTLTDPTVSRYHVELRAAADRVDVLDPGSTNGVLVGGARVVRGSVAPGSTLRLGRTTIVVDDGAPLEEPASYGGEELHGLRGQSAAMRRLMASIEQVARSDATVLLLGESGTGKELIARALHAASPRSGGPFEIVDCGALMPSLVESELLGHERGAFTGAQGQHLGAFERAHGGTIFLDEVGELSLELQVRLLGVLERRSFRRVGGSKPIAVDVRIVAATHRDLRKWVNSGDFRQDLYYRLAVARLPVPSLRERPTDIPVLVDHFLREAGVSRPRAELIPDHVLAELVRYAWPGNVRELRNFVESAIAFGQAPSLDTSAEETDSGDGAASPLSSAGLARLLDRDYESARDQVLRDFQTYYFGELLRRCDGNVSRAAAVANMNRPHLTGLLKRLGLR